MLFGSYRVGAKTRQSPDNPRLDERYTIEYEPNYPSSNECAIPYLIEYRQTAARKLDDLDGSRTASGGVTK